MRVIDDLAQASLERDTVLTIGTFDGVHLGHQALVHRVVDRARATDRLAGLVTFHPHPAVVLAPDRAPLYLTTPGEKLALLEGLGLDLVVLLPFSREVAGRPARDFMEAISHHLRVCEVWVGAGFALGRNREGNAELLAALGTEFGYDLRLIEPVGSSQEIVSSSRVRALLKEGRVEDASRLLGRLPSVSGVVVVGAQRGRVLGFPTANLEVRPERAVPANGVYAVYALLGASRHAAVANVGVRPSFDNGQRTVEIHLFDFHQDIYGCDLVVEFAARLRAERRFEDIRELVAQIQRDSEAARALLCGESQLPCSASVKEPAIQVGALPVRVPQVDCPFRYEELEHTADRALRVWGRNLPDLFVGAARGMYSLIADPENLVPTIWRQVRLEDLDQESLLVSWLNELIFLTETEGLLFVDFQIDLLSDTMLVGRAGGMHAPATKAGIKAATFHELALVPEGGGWSTSITFDV
jgi:riboflavin kinase/FMN adenylyltransferase